LRHLLETRTGAGVSQGRYAMAQPEAERIRNRLFACPVGARNVCVQVDQCRHNEPAGSVDNQVSGGPGSRVIGQGYGIQWNDIRDTAAFHDDIHRSFGRRRSTVAR
jgi:hypothetical protein